MKSSKAETRLHQLSMQYLADVDNTKISLKITRFELQEKLYNVLARVSYFMDFEFMGNLMMLEYWQLAK